MSTEFGWIVSCQPLGCRIGIIVTRAFVPVATLVAAGNGRVTPQFNQILLP